MADGGRIVQRANTPVTLVLIVWAWAGRGLVDGDGFVFDYLMALLAMLVFAPVLALVHAQRRLTRAQRVALVALWATLAVFGATVLSGGMPWRSTSVLTLALGDGAAGVSRVLAMAAFTAGVVAYATLLVLLLRVRRRA